MQLVEVEARAVEALVVEASTRATARTRPKANITAVLIGKRWVGLKN